MKLAGIAGLALAGLGGAAAAQDDFVPERLTVEERIPEGPNVLVMDQAWSGPSRVNVLGADDLGMRGNLSMGLTGQMALSGDGGTLYAASVYLARYTYGARTAVVQEFDVPTLSVVREIEVSPKLAQVETQPGLLALTADGAYLLAQNATPATSVTVVDLEAGAPIAEIPIPGCWTIEPAREGRRFTTLCGDGTLASFTFEPDGSFGEPARSEPIFDADEDALFANPARAGDRLVFASFKGNLYLVDDAGEAPALVETIAMAEGVEGDWAPGGSEVIAHHAPSDVVFVLMHSGAAEGSHKDGAEEIWAFDLGAGELLYRSVAGGETSIVATQTEPPILYALSSEEGALRRYEVDPEARFAAKLAGTAEGLGGFIAHLAVDR